MRDDTDLVIAALGRDLQPVRPIGSPLRRAAWWIGTVLLTAAVLACFADDAAMVHRLSAAPDMWLAVMGSIATMILAAVAAFHLSVPGRSAWWAALPLPGLALWLGASGVGCLRSWIVPEAHDVSMVEAGTCFRFIVLVSIPFSALMILMVRRAFPLRPNLTAIVAGLGVAAASATLLNFFHPYDASATDLVSHLLAILLVIGANEILAVAFPRRAQAPSLKTRP